MAVLKGWKHRHTPDAGEFGVYDIADLSIDEGDLVVLVVNMQAFVASGPATTPLSDDHTTHPWHVFGIDPAGAPGTGWGAYKVVQPADMNYGTFGGVGWRAPDGNNWSRYALLVFAAGTFDTANPLSWAVATDHALAPHTAHSPSQSVLQSQTIYHFGSIRSSLGSMGPGSYNLRMSLTCANGSPVVPLLTTDSSGQTIAEAGTYNGDWFLSAVYAQTPAATGSVAAAWDYAVTADPDGAYNTGDNPYSTQGYFLSFIVNDPPAYSRFPAMTSLMSVLTAAFSVAPVSPRPSERVLNVSPTISLYADGNPAPFQVQVQVSAVMSFASTVWTTTLTGVSSGPVSVTVGTALTDVSIYYWRARAGDGTSWGPWCSTTMFKVDTKAGRGFLYSYENIGIDATSLYQGGLEYVPENIGPQRVLYAGAAEYSDENVGAQLVKSPDGLEYVYEGDVSSNRPTPHLWFLWHPTGFANDEVWAYGQGFGNPQSQYGGLVKIDADPYTDTDVSPAITAWYMQDAGVDAYTEARKIYPGTDAAPPIVTPEVEIIKFIVPASIVPEDTEPATEHVYIQHSGGPSNVVNWIMYPTIPTAAANVPRPVSTATVLRLAIDRDSAVGIVQRYLYVDLPEYVISMGRPERLAAFGATARASATLGTWSVEDALADAAAVDLGATRRWLPDPATVVPRPDLGTGASLWVPSVGAGGMNWRLDELTAPYVDPAYQLQSRLGELEVPAMIFPGDAWAKLTAAAPSGPSFTVAMAAVLHPAVSGVGTLMSTFVDGTADANTFHWDLQLESDRIASFVGGKLRQRTLQVTSGRAVIAVVQVTARSQRMVLVDSKPSSTLTTHPPLQATGQKLYLGRANANDESIARMDVLDFAYWDRALTSAEMWAAANKLDGIYGVTG